MQPPIRLHPSWLAHLGGEFKQPYMQQLHSFLETEMRAGKPILPEPELWFNALNTTPLDKVKAVILAQDPYPTPGHAHGLCFSVRPEVKPLPKSLQNIFKELKDDLGTEHSANGCLQGWAEQGVLLLNTVLTVKARHPKSHQRKGWEPFTDAVIRTVSQQRPHVVFLLWGDDAQSKTRLIDAQKHTLLKAPHPSPRSAYLGFFGSKPFSKCNAALEAHQQTPIDWAK